MPSTPRSPSRGKISLGTNVDDPHGSGRRWSWVKFSIFFVFGGLSAFFGGGIFWFDELPGQLAFALVVATLVGCMAGRFGDRAIGSILSFLMFWTD